MESSFFGEKIKRKVDLYYIFNHGIERVWKILSDKKKTDHLMNHSGCIRIVKGNNTYEVGNEFEQYWIGNCLLHWKCMETENTELYKKITYRIDLDPYGDSYFVIYNLYQNTFDKSTLLKWETLMTEERFLAGEEKKQYIDKAKIEYLDFQRKYLDNNFEDLNQYESIMINANAKKVWDIIADWRILCKICTKAAEECEIDGDPGVVGTTIKLIWKKWKKFICYLKVIKIEKHETKWEYCVELIQSDAKTPKQEAIWTVVPLDNMDSCFLSWDHQFKEKYDISYTEKLKIQKQDILKILKSHLEKSDE
jgi:hypothetical protein